MAFYEFTQSNSGGSFDIDDQVCEYVVIEANSDEEANSIAESIGIYFNGVSNGFDCSCCGDRWYPAWGEGDSWSDIEETINYYRENNSYKKNCYIYYKNGEKEHLRF